MSTALQEWEAAQAAAAATAAVPHRGPDITLPGIGPEATWNDVYTWIEANSRRVRDDVEAQLGTDGAFISLEIQTYIGSVLKAVSTYVNNLYDAMLANTNAIWQYAIDTDNYQQAQLDRLNTITTNLVTSNYETREQIIPALFQQIVNLEEEVKQRDLIIEGQMQQWTEDNVYRPLFDQMQLLDQQTRERELVIAQQEYQYSQQQVQQEEWQRIAAVLFLQQQVDVILSHFETCVNDMCATMGPSTPLGKFLKALALASDAALIYELANLDQHGIEGLLRSFQSLSGGIIDKFDQLFLGGGGTLLDIATGSL